MRINLRMADYDQPMLLPESMRDWLPLDHLVWTVIDVVSQMDLSAMRDLYRPDGKGGAAYDPQMMVTLLLYAYTQGEHSARKISRLTHENVAFRVAAGNMTPDHSTISRFRVTHEVQLRELFIHSLRVCAAAGLVDVGVVALDGTKIKADASGFRNVDKKRLQEMIDAYFTQCRNDDDDDDRTNTTGEDLANSDRRLAVLMAAQEKIAQIEAEEDRVYAEKVAARDARIAAGNRMGGPIKHPRESKNYRPPKVNLSDPDSKIMKTVNGFVQGYNLQAVADSHQVIVAVDVCAQSNDCYQLAPMVDLATTNLKTVGCNPPARVLADAGYCQEKDFVTLGKSYPKTELFVSTKGANITQLKTVGPIPKNATVLQLMDRKMRTKRGKDRYKPRKWMIEPVFSRLKHNLKLKSLNRTGLKTARLEALLTAAAHNILKYFQHAQTA